MMAPRPATPSANPTDQSEHQKTALHDTSPSPCPPRVQPKWGGPQFRCAQKVGVCGAEGRRRAVRAVPPVGTQLVFEESAACAYSAFGRWPQWLFCMKSGISRGGGEPVGQPHAHLHTPSVGGRGNGRSFTQCKPNSERSHHELQGTQPAWRKNWNPRGWW